MKIVTVIGARPQFIKVAAVSKELRKYHHEILVHTGQHYDYNMSDIFFKELNIPEPDYNLGISGGTHGQMTGEMLIEIEGVLQKEIPDLVIVYGDTNSTIAASLAAVKLHIPICHIEAGVRLGTLKNPEEVNRVVTDHVSTLLMCCTKSAIDFLRAENIVQNVYLVGDPMYDAFKYYSSQLGESPNEKIVSFDDNNIVLPLRFYYLTCHREENTGSDEPLKEILDATNSLDYPCIYPVHPRNIDRAKNLKEKHKFENVILCKPVGYLTSIYLLLHSEKVITDSGGLQREAFFAEKQCVTVFNKVSWPETMIDNRNQLADTNKNDIINKLNAEQIVNSIDKPFGDGHSAKKIVKILNKQFNIDK